MKFNDNIEELLESLTLDEMIGQMLCYDSGRKSDEDILDLIKTTKAGSFFVSGKPEKEIKSIIKMMNENLKVPGMIAADVEAGPGMVFGEEETKLPEPMAWGAADDAELIKRAHAATAVICRKSGIHWSFSPVADINYNPDNPVTNIRAVSDRPELVAKICSAAIEGLQENGLMNAGCKHFPGDGMDDRNQHYCTTINSMEKEEWMNTYGYVYKELIKAGVSSVMVGHIALPAVDEKINDWVGYPPGTLSYNIITKLLRNELGFRGLIVSDALSMIGACACLPDERLAVEFVKAGGDMLLFPKKEYFYHIKSSVQNGEIPLERIKDAVRHVLLMKKKARLFEDESVVLSSIEENYNFEEVSQEIADKAITLIRNYDDLFPLKLKEGAKVLMVNLIDDRYEMSNNYPEELTIVKEELENRGYFVNVFPNASREDFQKELESYDVVLVNCKLSPRDYRGGSLRVNWQQIAAFWRGALLKHPKLVFTSFGCPYKLYDYPYLKTYINAYSGAPSVQRAFVKAILGEIPFEGKTPVSLKGFF